MSALYPDAFSFEENKNIVESKKCTSILSGDHNLLQSLYLCGSLDVGNKCYCEVCSVTCQKKNDLEYIGFIPGYCDCDKSTCKNQIYKKHTDRPLLNSKVLDRMTNEFQSLFDTEAGIDNSIPTYVMTSWFSNDNFLHGCYIESNELVKHSKETFWFNKDQAPKCYLEFMAKQVMIHHQSKVPSDSELTGVEFWVQVKPWLQEEKQSLEHKSIGLHYDKDENLAEDFDIGTYPYLSTVTYLTTGGASTLIMSNMQQSPIGNPIGEVTVSHPVKSKHICFTGTLLHGAPYIEILNAPRSIDQNDNYGDGNEIGIGIGSRVTFLVNLWVDHAPLGVNCLPTNIQEILNVTSKFEQNYIDIDDIGFERQEEPILVTVPGLLPLEEVIEGESKGGIEGHEKREVRIPFISSESEWCQDDEECTQQELWVRMSIPSERLPPGTWKLITSTDSLLAELYYPNDLEEEEEDQEEKEKEEDQE